MNSTFYLAIDRLPLGTVAAIEFLPVVVLAVLGARTVRNLAALALAVAGVSLLTDVASTATRSASPSPSSTPRCSPATSSSATARRRTARSRASTCSGWRC